MGTGNFSDYFKRDAVAQITERGYMQDADRQAVSESSGLWCSARSTRKNPKFRASLT